MMCSKEEGKQISNIKIHKSVNLVEEREQIRESLSQPDCCGGSWKQPVNGHLKEQYHEESSVYSYEMLRNNGPQFSILLC